MTDASSVPPSTALKVTVGGIRISGAPESLRNASALRIALDRALSEIPLESRPGSGGSVELERVKVHLQSNASVDVITGAIAAAIRRAIGAA